MTSRPAAGAFSREFSTLVPLRDGGAVRIRAIRPDDKQRLLGHFSRLSERSVYQRFFGFKRELTSEDLTLLTELDFVDAVGLVATAGAGDDERILGVGRYFVDPTPAGTPRRAEVAFAVEDAHQGRGIATRLLEQLLPFARQGRIAALEADVLSDNVHMLHVFSRMGFQTASSRHGVVRMSLPIAPQEQRRSA